MSKLEKYLGKAGQHTNLKTIRVEIDGDEWSVRQLTLSQNRACERLAERGDKFDWYRYNDARIVKATEHDFPWNDPQLLQTYGVGDKYELPARLFDHNPAAYGELLAAVREVTQGSAEADVVDELKN